MLKSYKHQSIKESHLKTSMKSLWTIEMSWVFDKILFLLKESIDYKMFWSYKQLASFYTYKICQEVTFFYNFKHKFEQTNIVKQ